MQKNEFLLESKEDYYRRHLGLVTARTVNVNEKESVEQLIIIKNNNNQTSKPKSHS